MSLVTGLFFPVLLLNQQWSPPLTLQASHCSTFRIVCYVPSIAVFCSESIECFPGIVSKFFFKLHVTIPVAPIITGTIVHFRFHIRCSSVHKLLHFNFFSASFCTTLLSAGIATSISVHVFSFFVFNYYIWPICCNFSVCVYRLIPQHCDISLFILGMYVCTICLWFQCLRLCILSNANVYKLYRVSLNIRSSHPVVKWSIVSSCCLHNRHLLSISSFKILFLK